MQILKRVILLMAVTLLFSLDEPSSRAQQPLPTSPPNTLIGADRYIRSERLGINFISSIDEPPNDERYRNALLLGAGWNRWPLYWDRVEIAPGQFKWDAYDRLVGEDLKHGLNINAILLGRPEFRKDGKIITGLNEPVFSDGSDFAAPGKTINPANPWANFVVQAVSRYMPNGMLARQQGWSADMGIRVWEVWNEPDFKPFWEGRVVDYARLLKVAYITAHFVDPNAQVMFGGLVYGDGDNWLAQVLFIFRDDPWAARNNWYMDMVAVHSYSYPWRSGWLVRWVKETLRAYGLKRPVWLNESGVPVWDDYPGPVWAANQPDQRSLRATAQQQADFFIQSTAYAWAEGADVVFFHQLYDDCGNQPAGTNFPPHDGELCVNGAACVGDAYGLFRNRRDAICFSQHPFAGTPRPAAMAFRFMAEIFGQAPFDSPKIYELDKTAVAISFDRQTTGERIYVIWNRLLHPAVVEFPADADAAELMTVDHDWTLIPDGSGRYRITLPAATPDDFPHLNRDEVTAIGGAPMILIERPKNGLGGTQPMQEAISATMMATFIPTPGSLVHPTPGPVVEVTARPTVDPAYDTTPPVTNMVQLSETSPPTFTVTWNGEDDSGIDHYLVWVRVNGGEWQPWLETERTSGEYSGAPGNIYEFAVWALDLGGNWSTNTQLQPQTATRVK